MYWEDVYEMYEQAMNFNTLEKNEDMKFQFMLHATTKDALNKWKDMIIPYPRRDWSPKKAVKSKTLPGIFGKAANQVRASTEEKNRFKEIIRRMQEQKQKIQEIRRTHSIY